MVSLVIRASSADGIFGHVTSTVSDISADWAARTSGPGVVWMHNFDLAAEVDNFRYRRSYGTDQDNEGGSDHLHWNSDGFAGGGCIEIVVPTGGTSSSDWWRIFSPLSGSLNGRGESDPAANGTISLETTYNPTTTDGYQLEGDNYGHEDYHNTGDFKGTDFYIQFRVKISGSRNNPSNPSGKLAYIDHDTGHDQEIVIQSLNNLRYGMYTSFGSANNSYLIEPQGSTQAGSTSSQPGGEYADTCVYNTFNNCWGFPEDEWVTVLIHVIPGHDWDGSGAIATAIANPDLADTGIEVWIAEDGDLNYTKIWEKLNYVWRFDVSVSGWDRIKFSGYMNGVNAAEGWTQKFTQVVFSHDFIPCPQVYGETGTALALACHGLDEGDSTDFTEESSFGEPDLAWQTSFHHDERHGVIHLMGKRANAHTSWLYQSYDVETDTWSGSENLGFNAPGHIYGAFTLDPMTGDVFQALGDLNGDCRAQWYQKETDTWGVTADFTASAVNDIPNGLVYHPHLFGRNDGGLVLDTQGRTCFWRRSTNTGTSTSHSSGVYGSYEGAAVYWPAQNVAFVGGGDGGQLAMITPNGTTTPTITAMGVPPVRLEGASYGGPAMGSIHVHPGNPNKLLIVETNGSRAWTSTDGSNWTQIDDHPFVQDARVVCSLRGGLGCLWSIGLSTGGTRESIIWKPPV